MTDSKGKRRHWRFIDLSLSHQFLLAGVLVLIRVVTGILGLPAMAAAVSILVLLILRILYNSIARPVSELSLLMQRLNDGDFTARAKARSRSEIGSLQSNFNRMAERIGGIIAEAKQLDQMKSEFISTVSHELRTPLTSIGGYVKLISAGDAGSVTDTQKEFLSIIEANVERLTGLINDVLDIEKLESGKIQLLKEPQDLRAILRECRESLLLIAHQKGINLKLDFPDVVAPVSGDRSRLIQIFNNLISNAIKYTQAGYVEIEIESKGYAVLVRIRDSGIGMSSDEQKKLFQKFYRTDAGLASKEKGTGLGLAISRGLIEAHGGTISVESTAGKGSTFTVSLPVTTSVYSVEEVTETIEKTGELMRAIQSVDDARADSALRAPKTIWILDPEIKDAEEMRRLIEKGNPAVPGQNLKTRLFRSGREIPQLTENEPTPAIVIVDPSALGGEVQLLSELRDKLHIAVPILVVSESVDTAVAFAEGASALITKPIGEREFWIAVQDLLLNRGIRVLVADANTDFRILIKRSLEQRGFEVDDVDRGKLVMGRLDHGHYDLLLLNLEFPDVSGIELLKAVRKRPQFNQVPVLLMFDGVQPPALEDFQSIGKDIYVGKERGIEGIVSLVAEELIGDPHELDEESVIP